MANKDNSPFMGNSVYLVMGTSSEEHNYKTKNYPPSYQRFPCERCDAVFQCITMDTKTSKRQILELLALCIQRKVFDHSNYNLD